jgi:hypothetical protein
VKGESRLGDCVIKRCGATNLGEEAMSNLLEAGISVQARKEPAPPGPGPRELDLWLERHELQDADRVLSETGFHRVRVRGHTPHRFYVAVQDGVWHKLDIKLDSRVPVPRWLRAVLRHGPAGMRRFGPVVAVVGSDTDAKNALLSLLRGTIPLAVSQMDREIADGGRLRFRDVVELASAHWRAWSGTIVICVDHPIAALIEDAFPPTARGRLERIVIRRLLPWPDEILVLDEEAQASAVAGRGPSLEQPILLEHPDRAKFAARSTTFVSMRAASSSTPLTLAGHMFEVLAGRATRGRPAVRCSGRGPS